jgi:membrane-associated phospholipid phosphatase
MEDEIGIWNWGEIMMMRISESRWLHPFPAFSGRMRASSRRDTTGMQNHRSSPAHVGLKTGILAAGILIFALLARYAASGGPVPGVDESMGRWLMGHASPTGELFFRAVTSLASPLVITTGTTGICLWLLWKKQRRRCAIFLTMVVGAVLVYLALGWVFARPRPEYAPASPTIPADSFPSGHAMNALAFYGALTWLAWRRLGNQRKKVLAAACALAISGLVGLSRVVLGVHYLTDVLAGWAGGVAWLAVCLLAEELTRGRDRM